MKTDENVPLMETGKNVPLMKTGKNVLIMLFLKNVPLMKVQISTQDFLPQETLIKVKM